MSPMRNVIGDTPPVTSESYTWVPSMKNQDMEIGDAPPVISESYTWAPSIKENGPEESASESEEFVLRAAAK